MKNTGLPDNPQNLSDITVDDIPEAVRDMSALDSELSRISQPKRQWRSWLLLGLGIFTFAITIWINSDRPLKLFAGQFSQQQVQQSQPTSTATTPSGSPSKTDVASTSTTTNPSTEIPSDALLGHLPYEEARVAQLENITADGGIKLKPAAAEAFFRMSDAARAEGIKLLPLSGFRTVAQQEYLFFGIKAQRGQNASKRAEVSAPPGYSEHHTGYAIDIGDPGYPDTHLEVDFEQTPAFQWLAQNAAHYSFELSFPENNSQGVSYEPWHWRYVGNRSSLETFYKERSTSTSTQTPKKQ